MYGVAVVYFRFAADPAKMQATMLFAESPSSKVMMRSPSRRKAGEPVIFGTWMRILSQVPGSVLWLTSAGGTMETNLRREARSREIDPARLVFVRGILPKAEHLARVRLADLFLQPLEIGTAGSKGHEAGAVRPVPPRCDRLRR